MPVEDTLRSFEQSLGGESTSVTLNRLAAIQSASRERSRNTQELIKGVGGTLQGLVERKGSFDIAKRGGFEGSFTDFLFNPGEHAKFIDQGLQIDAPDISFIDQIKELF